MTVIVPPSATKVVSVLSMTDKDLSIWSDASQVRLYLRKEQPDLYRDIYLWDLHALAKRGSFSRLRKTDPNWKKLWLSQYEDDSGSEVFVALPTAFAVAPFTYINAEAYVHRGSFTMPILVRKNLDASTAETYDGERAIWQAAIFPAMPLLFSSNIKSHQHYGPVFLSQFSIKSGGRDALHPVTINVNFEGGRAIKLPVLDDSEPITEAVEITGVVDPNYPAPVEDYVAYRTANWIDCMAATKVYTSVNTMREEMEFNFELEAEEPRTRLIEMELSVTQNVEFQVTGHKGRTTDQDGPRFAAIKERTVRGSVSYFSRDDSIIITNSETSGDTSQLTMYFGGPYLFPMSNVEWQKPQLTVVPGEGYVHTYKFIARAAENAISMGFKESANPVSEFELPTVEVEEEEE